MNSVLHPSPRPSTTQMDLHHVVLTHRHTPPTIRITKSGSECILVLVAEFILHDLSCVHGFNAKFDHQSVATTKSAPTSSNHRALSHLLTRSWSCSRHLRRLGCLLCCAASAPGTPRPSSTLRFHAAPPCPAAPQSSW